MVLMTVGHIEQMAIEKGRWLGLLKDHQAERAATPAAKSDAAPARGDRTCGSASVTSRAGSRPVWQWRSRAGSPERHASSCRRQAARCPDPPRRAWRVARGCRSCFLPRPQRRRQIFHVEAGGPPADHGQRNAAEGRKKWRRRLARMMFKVLSSPFFVRVQFGVFRVRFRGRPGSGPFGVENLEPNPEL